MSIRWSHTQNIDVDEGSDQSLVILLRLIRQKLRLLEVYLRICDKYQTLICPTQKFQLVSPHFPGMIQSLGWDVLSGIESYYLGYLHKNYMLQMLLADSTIFSLA